MKIYGIKNCSTVKKALDELNTKGLTYEFHDYKKSGIEASKIHEWLKKVDLADLINKKGTTYKKLNDDTKAALENVKTAIPVMMEYTSVIKRPILELKNEIIIGYNTDIYKNVIK